MDDPDAFLYLKAITLAASVIVDLPENSELRVVAPEQSPTQVSHSPEAPESPAPHSAGGARFEDDTSTREPTPCDEDDRVFLKLGFRKKPRDTSLGFVFDRFSAAVSTNNKPDHARQGLIAPDSRIPPSSDISRMQFRIHYNLSSGVLMITDSSTSGTTVGQKLIRKDATTLMTETTIFCGSQGRIGFRVIIPDHSRHLDLYQQNYRRYAEYLGCIPNGFIPTPTPGLPDIPLGRNYSILEFIGRGSFGTVNTVTRNKDGHIFAAKGIAGKEVEGYITFPQEVEIMRRLSHVSNHEFV